MPEIPKLPFEKKLPPGFTCSIPHSNKPRQNEMFFLLSIHHFLLNVKVGLSPSKKIVLGASVKAL